MFLLEPSILGLVLLWQPSHTQDTKMTKKKKKKIKETFRKKIRN
jgi:hypothetical protein